MNEDTAEIVVQGLVEQNGELVEENHHLTELNQELLDQNQELLAQNSELIEQNERLAEQNEMVIKKYRVQFAGAAFGILRGAWAGIYWLLSLLRFI